MTKIAILGFGREGQAVFQLLRRQGAKEVTILDKKFDRNYLKNLKNFDLVYRSPGVPYHLKEIQEAIKAGVKFTSATAWFFEKARGLIIGVTGTKGKGTTATLIYRLLKKSGRDVYLAGNIGKPAVTLLHRLQKNSITVLELSSFQLQDLQQSPPVAVVLDIFPDHLDVHRNFREYWQAKSTIAKYQAAGDRIFYAAGNPYAAKIANYSRGKKIAVDPAVWELFKPEDLLIRGEHNFKNAVMAATVALAFKLTKKEILETIKNYRGLPYRLSYRGIIRGRKIYNDSASTNPLTTAAAVRSFPQSILIMGGKDKKLNYQPVARAIQESATKLVVLFGENQKKIARVLKNKKTLVFSRNLETALSAAIHRSQPGDSIVFSPGSASFDMFTNYEERGKKFDEIVSRLKN